MLRLSGFAFSKLDLVFVAVGFTSAALSAVLYAMELDTALAAGALGVFVGSVPLALYSAHDHSIYEQLMSRLQDESYGRSHVRRNALAPIVRAAFALGESEVGLVEAHMRSEASPSRKMDVQLSLITHEQLRLAEVLGVREAMDRRLQGDPFESPKALDRAIRDKAGVEAWTAYSIGIDSFAHQIVVRRGWKDSEEATRRELSEHLGDYIWALFTGLELNTAAEYCRDIWERWTNSPDAEVGRLTLLTLECISRFRFDESALALEYALSHPLEDSTKRIQSILDKVGPNQLGRGLFRDYDPPNFLSQFPRRVVVLVTP